jgi:Ser/Thr protein kinase RdoA (MazF antagonist)
VVDVKEICEAFGLGVPTGPLSYVARGELGRVSRLVTIDGVWAVKEIELFVPTGEEADANVELQESMLAAGVHLPRPRRTVDGHGLFDSARVYEWLALTPVTASDSCVDPLVAESLARIHLHAPSTDRTPDPWYCEAPSRDDWDGLIDKAAGTWWAPVVAALVPELAAVPEPVHRPAKLCHLDVCPENVFLSDGRLIVIDWENAGPAATVQDLGSTLWDFCQGDVGRTRAFVDHYRLHDGPAGRLDASVFDMARVVHANLVDFHARRALDPAGTAEAHERADRALSGLLARPLTRRLVDDLVADWS